MPHSKVAKARTTAKLPSPVLWTKCKVGMGSFLKQRQQMDQIWNSFGKHIPQIERSFTMMLRSTSVEEWGGGGARGPEVVRGTANVMGTGVSGQYNPFLI
jgi:hypothetical protein